MAGIPEHIIDRIRESVNIVEVISRYVTLRKRGRNFQGLCPFHQEKTPSFSVNPEKQIFHCFGCGVGGNVFSFLMQHEKLSFVDAVKRLAEETGIEIPVSAETRQRIGENERLLNANGLAGAFFQRCLKSAPGEVTAYLQKRGLQPETVARFMVGYAPEGWDGLLKHLEQKKAAIKTYLELGLLLESEKSRRPYDRFRHRLMFPIHDPAGKIVGFGGRAFTDDKKTPKYINSPESPVYQKSRVLYGLFFAREAIRESGEALFVEGYMDVIQLHQSGIRNVVATSGTALTGEHARLIRRYAPRVLMCYDADSAGINAAVRGGEVLFQHGLEVTVLILPPGEDPDSYVKANGKEAFLDLLKEAGDYLSFRLRLLKEQFDLASAAGRSRAVAALVETLAEVQDSIRLSFYIEKAAQSLQLPPTLLHNQVRERQKQARNRGYFADNPPPPEAEAPPGGEDAPRSAAPLVFTGAWGGEKDVILLLISYFDHIYDYVQAHLQEEDFLNPEFRALFQLLLRQEKGAGKDLLHVVLDHLESEPLHDLLLREIEQTNSQFAKPALYLQGCIKEIKIARYKAKLDLLKRQIKELAPGDPRLLPLLQEMKTAGEAVKKWQDVVCSDEE